MFKTDIEFSKNTLYIDIEGPVNKKNIQKLKRKLYYIVEEYRQRICRRLNLMKYMEEI